MRILFIKIILFSLIYFLLSACLKNDQNLNTELYLNNLSENLSINKSKLINDNITINEYKKIVDNLKIMNTQNLFLTLKYTNMLINKGIKSIKLYHIAGYCNFLLKDYKNSLVFYNKIINKKINIEIKNEVIKLISFLNIENNKYLDNINFLNLNFKYILNSNKKYYFYLRGISYYYEYINTVYKKKHTNKDDIDNNKLLSNILIFDNLDKKRKKYLKSAIENLFKAIEYKHESKSKIYYYIAKSYNFLRDYNKAENFWLLSLKQKSNIFPKSYIELATYYHRFLMFDKALEYYNKVLVSDLNKIIKSEALINIQNIKKNNNKEELLFSITNSIIKFENIKNINNKIYPILDFDSAELQGEIKSDTIIGFENYKIQFFLEINNKIYITNKINLKDNGKFYIKKLPNKKIIKILGFNIYTNNFFKNNDMLNNKYFSFEKFKIKKQKIYPYHFIQTNHFCELKTDNQCNNFIIRFDVKK